jgi:hypothetical protein
VLPYGDDVVVQAPEEAIATVVGRLRALAGEKS